MKKTNDNKPKRALQVMIPVRMPDIDKMFPKKRNADRVRAILQMLFFIRLRMKDNPDYAGAIDRASGYCPVKSKSFKSVAGNGYRKLIARMLSEGIIQVNTDEQTNREKYTPRKWTKLYRINPKLRLNDYRGRSYRREQITDETVIQAVKRHYDNHYANQVKEVAEQDKLYKDIVRFGELFVLDVSQLEQDIQTGKVKDEASLLGIANSINDGILRWCARDAFGKRLHTHLGNMPKELRPFLRLKGQPDTKLVMADISASQPYFLSLLFYKPDLLELVPEFNPIHHKLLQHCDVPDTRLFYEDCAAGEFYSKAFLMMGEGDRVIKDIAPDRKKAMKEKLFRHIFYASTGNHFKNEQLREERHRTEIRFGLVYPCVLHTLRALKKTKKDVLPFVYELTKKGKKRGKMYATTNMLAQRFESRIVLDYISRLLFSEGIHVFTIHDAWILAEQDLPALQRALDDIFRIKLNVKPPQLKVTRLTAGQQ